MARHYPKLLIGLLGAAVLGGGLYLGTRKSPEDHLRKGIALQQAGDLKGAAIELKNTLQALPKHAEARYRLGQIHFAQGDYLGAEKELKKARELGLGDAELAQLHARTLLLIQQPQRLLDEVKASPDAAAEARAAILALRARARLMLKDESGCAQALSEADAASRDHPESLVTRALLAVTRDQSAQGLPLLDLALAKAPGRADFWLLKGDLLRAGKQDAQAMLAYGKAIEGEPANIPARLARAQLFVQAGELDKADADIAEVRKAVPNQPLANYLGAFTAFKRGRLAEADGLLQGVLRVAPDLLPAHLLAGTVNIAQGKREAARAHLDKVLAVAPQHPLARKLMAAALADLGDLNEAKRLIASFGNDPGDPLLNALQGQIALRQGDYAEARKHLEQMPAGATQNARYYTDLATSRLGSGDEAGAISALDKAAELDTQSARPDVFLVMLHMKEKRYAEALRIVDRLAQERPKDPLVHNLRGGIYLNQNDPAKARASFEQALRMDPAYLAAASNLARLDMRDGNVKAARARFQKLLAKNPKEAQAWLALAEIDARTGNDTGYLDNIEQAVKVDEKLPQPHIALIRYWLGKKDAAKALVAARSALNATGRADFQEYIGLALQAQGDLVSAQATFAKWAESSPKNPMTHYRLARAKLAAKDNEGALKSLDQALALQPAFAEAGMGKAMLLARMGRAEEGLRIVRAWQAQNPRHAVAYLTEAEILFDARKYLDAARLYAKGARLAGMGSPLGKAHKAYALAGQAAEGDKVLGEWLKEHPADTLVRHQLAIAQLNGKRLKEAADNYRILARANPRDLVAYNNLAWLLGELRDKEAAAVAEQALRLSPDDPATQDTVGWVLVNAGQAKRGLELLAKAHAKAPAIPEIHWHWAAALAKAGDLTRAKQELEKLIYSGLDFPQKPEAKRLLETL